MSIYVDDVQSPCEYDHCRNERDLIFEVRDGNKVIKRIWLCVTHAKLAFFRKLDFERSDGGARMKIVIVKELEPCSPTRVAYRARLEDGSSLYVGEPTQEALVRRIKSLWPETEIVPYVEEP
jgi:hypothetical protein